MLKQAYFFFIGAFIACWTSGRHLASTEKAFKNAKWLPPSLLLFLFPKKYRMVTLHNLIFMTFTMVLSIYFQIMFIYWRVIGYEGDAIGIPLVLLTAAWTFNGVIYGINYYIDYRRRRRSEIRKNRIKF